MCKRGVNIDEVEVEVNNNIQVIGVQDKDIKDDQWLYFGKRKMGITGYRLIKRKKKR